MNISPIVLLQKKKKWALIKFVYSGTGSCSREPVNETRTLLAEVEITYWPKVCVMVGGKEMHDEEIKHL